MNRTTPKYIDVCSGSDLDSLKYLLLGMNSKRYDQTVKEKMFYTKFLTSQIKV